MINIEQLDNNDRINYLLNTADDYKELGYFNNDVYEKYANSVVNNCFDDSDWIPFALFLRRYYILNNEDFNLSKDYIYKYNKILFDGIMNTPKRKINITKKEKILGGKSIHYSECNEIEKNLLYDFDNIKNKDYNEELFIKFISHIWETHPFMEGNTRTIEIFMQKYLRSIGFNTNPLLYMSEYECLKEDFYDIKENTINFRDTLVYANNEPNPDTSYLKEYVRVLTKHQ